MNSKPHCPRNHAELLIARERGWSYSFVFDPTKSSQTVMSKIIDFSPAAPEGFWRGAPPTFDRH